MRLEELIGANVARLREERSMSQAQLGEALAGRLDKPWSRQAVSAAEKGRRSFTAVELLSLGLALDVPLPELLLSFGSDDDGVVRLPGGEVVDRGLYERMLLLGDDETDPELVSRVNLHRVRFLFDRVKSLQGRTLELSEQLAEAQAQLIDAERHFEKGEDE